MSDLDDELRAARWPIDHLVQPGSPLWCDFIGGFMDGERHVIPLYDLSETPFMCAGDGERYQHYLRHDELRLFTYVAPCDVLPGLDHINP